jgi:hypothetical protein
MSPNDIPVIVKLCCGILQVLGLVVIIPIAQHILNRTVVTLPYSVIYPCDGPFAELTNDATIHIPGIFGAVLDPYETILSTDTHDEAGRAIKTRIGYATFPNMALKHGDNALDFSVGVELSESALTNFIVPMFTEGKTVKLYIDADKVTLRVVHYMKVPGLHLHKVLVCHGTNMSAPKEIPARYCHPTTTMNEAPSQMDELFQQVMGRRLNVTPGDMHKGYEIQCVADKGDSSDQSVVV